MRESFAVVTGASSGIGLELSLLFAQNDFDLLLCAEDDGLESAAGRCRAHGAEVSTFQRDLRGRGAAEELHDVIIASGRPVDAAALNAGIGRGGAFVSTPLPDLLDVVDLDVVSTLVLCHKLLNDMVTRDSGRLLITSSIASTMPGAFQAVYNASKSFVQSLAEALQEELRDTAVTITSLMPGPTETDFFARAGMEDTVLGQAKKDDPADVAKQGFEAMLAGRKKVVAASLGTKLQEAATAVLPDSVKAKFHAQQAAPRDAED